MKTAHGLLPVPAPAVVELLKDVPVYGSAQAVELTTPTGAALLAGLAEYFGPLPPVVSAASGYGAGTREFEGVPMCSRWWWATFRPVPVEDRAGSRNWSWSKPTSTT